MPSIVNVAFVVDRGIISNLPTDLVPASKTVPDIVQFKRSEALQSFSPQVYL